MQSISTKAELFALLDVECGNRDYPLGESLPSAFQSDYFHIVLRKMPSHKMLQAFKYVIYSKRLNFLCYVNIITIQLDAM